MKRDRATIKLAILDICARKGGAGKTEIVYGANLNFRSVKSHLEDFRKAGLIEQVTNGKIGNPGYRVRYEITETGLKAAELLRASGLVE